VVKYLKLVEPANTKADGREYKQKMIGFGLDGTSDNRKKRCD